MQTGTFWICRRIGSHAVKSRDTDNMNYIGKALAGHAARVGDKNNPKLDIKASKYENPLTDLVNLIIAEQKAQISINEINAKLTGIDPNE